jgi:hypothetical protein
MLSIAGRAATHKKVSRQSAWFSRVLTGAATSILSVKTKGMTGSARDVRGVSPFPGLQSTSPNARSRLNASRCFAASWVSLGHLPISFTGRSSGHSSYRGIGNWGAAKSNSGRTHPSCRAVLVASPSCVVFCRERRAHSAEIQTECVVQRPHGQHLRPWKKSPGRTSTKDLIRLLCR